jgi:hypothetical protein
MPKASTIIDAETGATPGQIGNVANLQIVANLTPDEMADAIRADVATFDRHTRLAAFVALRIGLRLLWIRDNGRHGDIGKFIAAHLKDVSRRSLNNYLNVAECFAVECKLVDRKTHLLSNGDRVAPILNEQLELFADPKARFEGELQKVVKWVGDRGLSQIYRDIASGADSDHGSTPQSRGKRTTPSEADRRDADEQDARDFFARLKTHMAAEWYQWLDEQQLDELRAIGGTLLEQCPRLIKQRRGRA